MAQPSTVSSPNVSECSLPARIRFTGDDRGFRNKVAERVEAYLAARGGRRYADEILALKAVSYGAAMIALYVMMLQSGSMWWRCGLFAVGYGVCALLLAINAGHDAAHGALTGNRRADTIIQRVLFVFVGIDGYLWQMRHLGSHHVFPNVNGCDNDIDENPFLRLSPNHARKPWQRWQHLFAVPIYTLTLLHSVFWGDWAYLRQKSLANMRRIHHHPRDVAGFFVTKLVYLAISLAIPMIVLPFAWWQVLLGYWAVTSVMSLLFVFMLVGTHFSDQASFPRVGEDGTIPISYSEHVLATSVDWAPEDPIAVFISGGANAHAAHHLFPRLSHRHSPEVTRIIRATAREFAMHYNETSFTGMVLGHFRHLKALGEGDLHHEGERDEGDAGVHLLPAA